MVCSANSTWRAKSGFVGVSRQAPSGASVRHSVSPFLTRSRAKRVVRAAAGRVGYQFRQPSLDGALADLLGQP